MISLSLSSPTLLHPSFSMPNSSPFHPSIPSAFDGAQLPYLSVVPWSCMALFSAPGWLQCCLFWPAHFIPMAYGREAGKEVVRASSAPLFVFVAASVYYDGSSSPHPHRCGVFAAGGSLDSGSCTAIQTRHRKCLSRPRRISAGVHRNEAISCVRKVATESLVGTELQSFAR